MSSGRTCPSLGLCPHSHRHRGYPYGTSKGHQRGSDCTGPTDWRSGFRVERELAADASCAKVLHLVAAVRGAVNGLMDEIIAEHLEAHVSRAGLTDEERAEGAENCWR